jgi:hypothetical protein
MTAHSTPASAPTVAGSLAALFNAAFNATPIDLETVFPGANASEQPYQPDIAGHGSGPAPLLAATGQLEGACATGGTVGADDTRSSQTWGCENGAVARPDAGTSGDDGWVDPALINFTHR